MDIDELAKEYDKQYKVLCAKVDGLKPLLSVYRGEDLFKLRRKMRIYLLILIIILLLLLVLIML